MHNPGTARTTRRVLGAGLVLAALAAASPVLASDAEENLDAAEQAAAAAGAPKVFRHVGTFNVPDNLPTGTDINTPTSAEIVDVTTNGRTLLYSDSPNEVLGFIDITNSRTPTAAGTLPLGGEPTSVAVVRNFALVGVNTSADFVNPSGELVIVDTNTRAVIRTITLAGQPDSIAVSPDKRYAAIVIENERDEDLNDGLVPQLPAGALQVVRLTGPVSGWSATTVDLTGLADIAPSDPEPEYVDINSRNRAVVSLQENNHLVVVDLPTASVWRDYSAGSVSVSGIDTEEEDLGPQGNGLIELTGGFTDRRREPDAVAWINDHYFATANEGDYEDADGDEGGTRGFTVFRASTGEVLWDAGNRFEHEVVRAGHYNEGRSENKGNEPEGLEVGTFDGRTLLFVGSERSNAVAVYDVSNTIPRFLQILPTGMGPEGIKAIPSRNLVAVSAEVDGKAEDPGDQFDVRSLVTLYEMRLRTPSYPQLVSDDEAGLPIPWVAISGLAGDPEDEDTVWAVSDSFLAQSWMYRVDVSKRPARITDRIAVGGPDGAYDLEGIAARPDGGFWLASEGRGNDERRNLLVRVDDDGTVLEEIALPQALVDKDTSSGFEGVAVKGTGANEMVYVVVQREWDGDPKGAVYVGRYEVATDEWTFALYPLDAPTSPNGGWVGLSELTLLPGGTFAVVERDNQIATNARIKKLYRVDLDAVAFAAFGGPLPTMSKTLMFDAMPSLDRNSISVPDKLEGAAVTADGTLWLATDNDGVDENYGETLFYLAKGSVN